MRIKNLVVAFVVLFFVMGGVGLAQTGSVTGQVFDPGGAVIPNATVTVTSNSTGLSRTTTTTSAGIYSFPALTPATYTVSVDAEGFAPQVNKNVVLNVGGTLPVNFHMAVAGAVASVEVQGVNSTAVETGSAQLSTVIDSKQISNLPLVLRDPYQLVLLSPGTVTATNNDGGFAVNGARDRNNNFMLDGADNNDTSVPGIPGGISSANPDSTQEFRVITNNFDAEYGRNTGAIIDVVTRGGGNQFHGDAYEYGRYSALGARDFFNRKEDGKQDSYVRNLFGASLGGPLWKDHTFFFLNAEIQRFRTTRTAVQTTPTAAYKSGKFTYVDPTDGSQTNVDLTQPNTNNISGFLQDPTVSKILSSMPVGQIDNGDGVTTSYFFPSPDPNDAYTLTGRFDQKLTDKHQLTVRYIYGHSKDADPFHDEILPGIANTASIQTSHNGVITLNSALSASMTNQLRAGYNQANSGFFCTNHEAIDALTGVDGFGNGRDIDLPGFFTFGCSPLGDSNSQARLSSTLLFGDTFSVTKGAHTWKFGGVFRSVKDNSYTNFNSRNTLTFDNYTNFVYSAYNFNGNPDSPSVRTFEDMVWGAQGVVSNTSESQFFTREGVRRAKDLGRYRQHEWAAFAQDTWKVTPKFTAILGIRYAFNGVPYEKDGNLSNFYGDASAPLPAIGYFAFTPVGPGTGKQLYANSWKMIEPRVGFAYDLNGDGKTAIRGGFGIFHDRIFDNLFGNARSNPPFQATLNAYPFTGDSTSPTLTDIGIPGQLTPEQGPTDGDFLTPVVIDPNLKMPTSLSYNIGIQHQIRNGLTVELNYVGNHNTHGLREIDGAPPQPALVQQLLASGVPPDVLQTNNLYLGGTYGPDDTPYDPAVNNQAFLHSLFQTAVVSGNYNSLQASVRGQFGGLTLTGSYTYAHSLDNGSDPIVPGAGGSGLPRNSFDLLSEYGNSDFDVRHRGTAAATYQLPIGLHTAHLNSGFLGHVLEGIQISGIEQVQTGLPFDLRGTRDNLHTGVTNRPEMIGAPYPSHRGEIVAQGKITGPARAAFANAPFGQSVSIRRNKFYGPGYIDTDVSFQKTQTLHEQVKLVFRAESYNVLNHPNLASPGSLSISSSTFGISQSQIGQNDGTTGARQIQGALKVVF
ncbi:MAG TPA: TonB-dependent receptor [Edaphobacter sp.]|nr:TonB-dependent receptor [Edaphobacter sp.]